MTAAEMTALADAGSWELLEAEALAAAARNPERAEGWRFLGRARLQLGKWSEALEALAAAAMLAAEDAELHIDLGQAFYRLGREQEAEAGYRRALQCDPRSVKALNNLGALLSDLGRLAEAAANFQRSLEIDPDSDFALHCLGALMDRVGGHDDQAIAFLERSIALNPGGADACVTLGNVLLRTGDKAGSASMFRRARELRPLISWRARKERADFSALLLYAPGSGCTPVNYLVGKAPYDCHFYCVLPDAPHDLDLLRAKADVVINTIADADYGREILPFARDLAERLGRPTVNTPRLIMDTDRESVARRLAGIPFCRIPKSARLAGAALMEAAQSGGIDAFAVPLLVRLAGNHGGDDFEKLADWNAVADFVSKRPEATYYATEYLECRSSDGFFRKYRLIGVDGQLMPYHLAIHDDWKVHHFRTDMANREWMRREEESFLKNPRLVFDEPRLAALRAAAASSGLGYCGIDCAPDRDGLVVLFETNASMLVHDEKDQLFAYKNPYIARIKDAFGAMLARLAAGGSDEAGAAAEPPGAASLAAVCRAAAGDA